MIINELIRERVHRCATFHISKVSLKRRLSALSIRTLDDHAMAYEWLMIGFTIIGLGLVLIFLTPSLNGIFDFFNSQVAAGYISQQTVDCVERQRLLFVGMGGIILLGILLYVYQRSVEKGGGLR